MPRSFVTVNLGSGTVDLSLLESIDVSQALNQHSHCTVSFRQTSDNRFDLEGSIGADLSVKATGEDGDEVTIFSGFVSDGSLEYEVSGSYSAQVTGMSESYRMSVRCNERYFPKKTLSDVAQALASDSSIEADVSASAGPQRNYVQWGESDFDFLRRIADDNESWIRPTESGIEIRNSFAAGRSIEFRGLEGDGLMSFRIEARVRPQTMGGVHYDPKKMTSQSFTQVQKAPSFSGAIGSLVSSAQSAGSDRMPEGYLDFDARAPEASDYQDLLQRESLRSIGGAVSAWGTSRTEALKPGDTVDIQGKLDAAGTYGIVAVSHHWDPTNGYTNGFTCTPNQNWIEPHPPPAARAAGVIHARVVDNNDPAHLGRLKIQYDWLDDGMTSWARLVVPHAGGSRGFLFLPEIGDEVLVGFLHGDPERPYVLGSLWNGVDQAPRQDIWGGDADPNDVKRIVTKSGHRIQLSDKAGKEAIVIATPSKLKLSMLEKADETGRPMLLMHAAEGDILISAPNGRIHFHSAHFSKEVGGGGSGGD